MRELGSWRNGSTKVLVASVAKLVVTRLVHVVGVRAASALVASGAEALAQAAFS